MSNTLTEDPYRKTTESLDQYANERWESVLQFLVQPQNPKAISRDAIRTLLHAKLIETLVAVTQIINPTWPDMMNSSTIMKQAVYTIAK